MPSFLVGPPLPPLSLHCGCYPTSFRRGGAPGAQTLGLQDPAPSGLENVKRLRDPVDAPGGFWAQPGLCCPPPLEGRTAWGLGGWPFSERCNGADANFLRLQPHFPEERELSSGPWVLGLLEGGAKVGFLEGERAWAEGLEEVKFLRAPGTGLGTGGVCLEVVGMASPLPFKWPVCLEWLREGTGDGGGSAPLGAAAARGSAHWELQLLHD